MTGSGLATRPGASVGTTNRLSRPCPVAWFTPVRATTRIASASFTPEMKYLVPRRTQPPVSRLAVVDRLWVFEPASGSVMAKTILLVAAAIPGSHRCFCSPRP